MSDKLYTVSLKGSTANQPWVVINADNADDLSSALDALSDPGDQGHSLYQQIADANALYQGVANVANPAQHAPAPAPAAAPQSGAYGSGSAQQAQTSYGRRKESAGTGGRGGQSDGIGAGVTPEACHHGDRVYREGNGARGPWAAWFCPSARGTVDQCKPLFVRD